MFTRCKFASLTVTNPPVLLENRSIVGAGIDDREESKVRLFACNNTSRWVASIQYTGPGLPHRNTGFGLREKPDPDPTGRSTQIRLSENPDPDTTVRKPGSGYDCQKNPDPVRPLGKLGSGSDFQKTQIRLSEKPGSGYDCQKTRIRSDR